MRMHSEPLSISGCQSATCEETTFKQLQPQRLTHGAQALAHPRARLTLGNETEV